MRFEPADDVDADEVSHWERSKLQEIYEVFRTRGDAPRCLREYLDQKIGRVLP